MAAAGPVTLMNEGGLAYSTSPAQNLNAYGSPNGVASKLSAQVTWSSTTFASQNFTDGSASTTSITVANNNLLALSATDQITVPATSASLGSPSTAQFTIITT